MHGRLQEVYIQLVQKWNQYLPWQGTHFHWCGIQRWQPGCFPSSASSIWTHTSFSRSGCFLPNNRLPPKHHNVAFMFSCSGSSIPNHCIVSGEWELTLTDPIQNPRLILWPILWLIPWLTLSLAQWLTLLLLWCQGFALWQCNRCILLSTVVTEKSSWNNCVQPHFLGSINSIENLIHSFRKLPFWTITDSGNISLHFHKICEVVLFKCDYFFSSDSYATFLCKYIFGYSLMARFLQMPPAKIAGSTFNSTKKLDKILSQENPEDFKRTSE